ncbi:MAG TPA: SDR family oxidoreductase [Mycobacteriales bacterium]|jgi:NAD(P)-dependent dehydrogenase (short-subunit alcohol dehydrogenase family)|nr:SDR family oxidoreductase [Mycobacteriales bacterium]
MGLLDGKVAIVTGAGRGLGREHALLLAAEGAQVIVNDLGGEWDGTGKDDRPVQQVVDEITAAGGAAAANHDSCSDWKSAEGMVQQAIDTFGGLDIVVNNAGILRDKMGYNMDESDWDSVIDVHLKGHFAVTHFAAKHWRERSKAGDEVYGRIVNTASESGMFGNAGQSNYAAAKAGIIALTVVTARELAKIGVTANAIAPRARTRMTENTFAGFGAVEEGGFDEWGPANVAPIVAWLASPAAGHITGQLFVVWGSQVQLARPWQEAGKIDAGKQAWTVEGLIDAAPKLFANQDPGLPPFGFAEG